MTGFIKKLFICATAEGLLLQSHRDSEPLAVKVAYKTNTIHSTKARDDKAESHGVESHGIVGLLNLVSSSYLVSIQRRDQVARIRGVPVYVITDVALIPLSSQSEADGAIRQAREALRLGKPVTSTKSLDEDDADDDSDVEAQGSASRGSLGVATPADDPALLSPGLPQEDDHAGQTDSPARRASIFRDVLTGGQSFGKKLYGATGSVLTKGRSSSVSGSPKKTKEPAPDAAANAEAHPPAAQEDVPSAERVITRLTPRIVAITKLYFCSRNFFFAYDYNLSRSLDRQDLPTDGTSHVSARRLSDAFDPLYFWNRSLIEPFREADQYAFVLPIMQGFVGERQFTVAPPPEKADEGIVGEDNSDIELQMTGASAVPSQATTAPEPQDFSIVLVSRRSVKRAGLRYLRRGVDDDGNVANNVETEQMLLCAPFTPEAKAFSFVQVRGSIPLFFSQTPYSFKPTPVQHRSLATNQAAAQKHFAKLVERYGDVQVASLVEKHGVESSIGKAYEEATSHVDVGGKKIEFEWFDFHSVCRGMKFENVSFLMRALSVTMSSFGYTVVKEGEVVKDDKGVARKQKGVLRTNCMDCLDRTNVVQSGAAGEALQSQLRELGLSIDLQTDPSTSWFNTLWADNGDSISRQYAGTAALKGDFTRTRKRDFRGALNDFSLTLNRYWNNMFLDYFLQACIDYWLGSPVGARLFEDFENDMMSQDYSVDLDHLRQNAIDVWRVQLFGPTGSAAGSGTATPQPRPQTDPPAGQARPPHAGTGEDMVAGWPMLSPHAPNTLTSHPFDACALILSETTLYLCRYDWDSETTLDYEAVDYRDIVSVRHGTYISSTHGPAHTDERRNVGFEVRFRADGAVRRVNTRAVAGADAKADATTAQVESTSEKGQEEEQGNADADKAKDADAEQRQPQHQQHSGETRILGFKALPAKAGGVGEAEQIKHVCGEIERLAEQAWTRDAAARRENRPETRVAKGGGADEEGRGGEDGREGKGWTVEESDIVSLADARRSTGYFDALGYSLKKLVWS